MDEEYNHSYTRVNNLGYLTFNNYGCSFAHMTFSERLKAARAHAKLSQQELIDRLGTKPDGKPLMTQANLAKLETNPKAKGSIYTVFLARACGINPEWLANEVGEMVDGIYVHNEKIKRAVLLMQDLPDYAVDEAIKSIDTVAKLTQLGQTKTQK